MIILKWLVDCVVNVEIGGKLITLYKDLEFEGDRDDPYIQEVLAAGHAEIIEE